MTHGMEARCFQVEFDEGALTRLGVAPSTDPLWETVLSLHLLQNGQESLAYDPWRREVRGALRRHRTGSRRRRPGVAAAVPARGPTSRTSSRPVVRPCPGGRRGPGAVDAPAQTRRRTRPAVRELAWSGAAQCAVGGHR
ncbi:hypothetical protein LV779_08450 [Streptomyces thinghirensis]|nr:hypothetical protein [Streptomyces thinghirensis]